MTTSVIFLSPCWWPSQLVLAFIVIWNSRWLDPFPLRTIYRPCRMCFWYQCCISTGIREIPSMLVSYDGRARQAGLMAIATIAEGTSNDMLIISYSESFPTWSYLYFLAKSHHSHVLWCPSSRASWSLSMHVRSIITLKPVLFHTSR